MTLDPRVWQRPSAASHARTTAAFFVVALLCAILAREAGACSCIGPLPPCEAAGQAELVFEGQVRSVVEIDNSDDASVTNRSRELRVTFDVLKAWRGSPAGWVEALTEGRGSSCHYGFTTGRRYLVYAVRLEGELRTGQCTRTLPLERAAADLAALELSTGTGIRIFGTATTQTHDAVRGFQKRTPVAGAQVTVSGSETRATTTGPDGTYLVDALKAGTFVLTATVADGRTVRVPRATFELGSPGCAQRDLDVFWDGRIAGTVVDGQGRPLTDVIVSAAPRGAFPATTRLSLATGVSDEAGRFEIVDLPLGHTSWAST